MPGSGVTSIGRFWQTSHKSVTNGGIRGPKWAYQAARSIRRFTLKIALERTTPHALIVLGSRGRKFKSRQPDKKERWL